MTIELTLFSVLAIIIIFIVITEHLLSWWLRSADKHDNEAEWATAVIVYLIKWLITLLLLYSIIP